MTKVHTNFPSDQSAPPDHSDHYLQVPPSTGHGQDVNDGLFTLNETTSINLSPGQAINYDSINDSTLLDAAASVDRRVGSHFQNQRLNQINHQYHLQRSPMPAVQSPGYSRYEVIHSSNGEGSTSTPKKSHLPPSELVTSDIFFDEDRDSEPFPTSKVVHDGSTGNDKSHYHYDGDVVHGRSHRLTNDSGSNLDGSGGPRFGFHDSVTHLPYRNSIPVSNSNPGSSGGHLTNLPLPAYKVSTSVSSSSSGHFAPRTPYTRRPFVPPYSGFESTRTASIRTSSSVSTSATATPRRPIIVVRVSPDPSTSNHRHSAATISDTNRANNFGGHDLLPRRRPPKRLELPSVPPPPPPPPANPHHNSPDSFSPHSSPTVAPFDNINSEIETHLPTFSVFESTTTTSTTPSPFALPDRDEELTEVRTTSHAQTLPPYQAYHNNKFDQGSTSNDGYFKSTRSPFGFQSIVATSTAPSSTTTSASVSSTSSYLTPEHGQPIGLFDYEATVTESSALATETPTASRVKKLLKPKKRPPPSPYIATFDESPSLGTPIDSAKANPVDSNNDRPSEGNLFGSLSSQPLTPIAFSNAEKCEPHLCQLPNCNCGSPKIPGGLRAKDVPQIVLLTFDDAINDLNWEIYEEIFNSGRKNPNGCPILGTFYVSHEWTDYSQVQTLYSRGHEMASHGVSHSFGEKFTKNQWHREVHGQRQILNLYGGVKMEDVRGMRAPFLQVGGNKQFEMLYEANFTYDSSMPVFENNPPYFPYTLDYALNHECMIAPCPTKSYPGLWEIGMIMWEDLRGGRCSMADACQNPSDSESIFKFLIKNFNRHYKSNRAPFGLFYHSAWFNTDHHRKGFIKFLDHILTKSDVYFVTNWQMIQWMKEPTSLDEIGNFKPWKCDQQPPIGECLNPHVCTVKHEEGSRFMKTCQSCPSHYPWVGRV